MGAEDSTTARARRKQQRSTRSARQHLPPPSCAHEGGPPRGRSHTGQSRPPAAGSAPRSSGPAALLGRGRIFSGRSDAPGVGCVAVRQRGARLPEGVGAARREPSARREGRGWAGAAPFPLPAGGRAVPGGVRGCGLLWRFVGLSSRFLSFFSLFREASAARASA